MNPTEEEGNTWGENGILISWDAPDESDEVHEYSIYRGVLVTGISPASTEVSLQGTITNVRAWNSDTGTYTEPANPPEDIMDPEEYLEVGVTYVYRAVATRWDNCGDYQDSEKSDPVTATYQAPPDEQGEGDTDEDDEFVGGL